MLCDGGLPSTLCVRNATSDGVDDQSNELLFSVHYAVVPVVPVADQMRTLSAA
jgi:hypothetical protein